MHDYLLFIVIVFGVSALVVYLLGRLRVPSIVGFLFAGLIVGPHGLALVHDIKAVELVAEIGVVLLMFVIGLEFSLKTLMQLRGLVVVGGALQVALTILLVALIASFGFRHAPGPAVFYGFLVALSSTAIAIKLLQDRGELNAPHGMASLGILIFQDLCVVPLMLLIPVLAGTGGSAQDIIITIGKAAVFVAGILLASRWAVPHILHQVVHTKSRELFIITVIMLCLGTAVLTAELGLSLALGAFLAGIVISESEYSSQSVSDILPLKESFSALFFVSIGMLLDLRFAMNNAPMVCAIVLIILLVKVFATAVAAYGAGQALRPSLQTGFCLAQVGEFSFVLAAAGKAVGLIPSDEMFQLFLSASVFTMMLTPMFVITSARLSEGIVGLRPMRYLDKSRKVRMAEHYPSKLLGHVIIVGFGLNGRNLARVLRDADIPYVVLEMNSTTVRKMRQEGEPIFFGDGTSAEILHQLHIHSARILVVAISDAAATRRVVQIARHENPQLRIIVRTRYLAEMDDLKAAGANEVIPEEFETSVEIFARVLHHYHVPKNAIHQRIEEIRDDNYTMLRGIRLPAKALSERHSFLKGLHTETYQILKGTRADGVSIKALRLRAETGATILAVQRNDEVHQNPSPDFHLHADDLLLLIGNRESVEKSAEYLAGSG
ncbi:MAG: monovalent cation:H+ antiporter-2 CPA2 family [Nitrospirae bacterium]|nr:MAG: monovalent cation:H+ antiporter-2 CPA2 family [Nitrospirota bacterium]